ncbi:ATP-dependent DNA helicase [Trichonephila clavipes]|nr:ATP-dependent DNA helicase [Trichonephila clavipes]
MPAPTRAEIGPFDVDLSREQSYNISDLQLYVQSNIPKLTCEQKGIYDRIMQMINDRVGDLLCMHQEEPENISYQIDSGNGDFRQTLPVISRLTPADEINACLKYSTLWRHVHILQLTTNMRVQLQNDRSAEVFSRQNHNWLSERAVLAAKNKDVYQLNHFILSSIQSEKVIYKSIDTVVEADEVVNYPSEFLNSLDLPGMSPHVLKLKTGVPVIMLRNVNQPKLCNGTRLAVKKLMNNVVEATILTGPFKGEDVLIPRIPMIPTDTPFKFKRLQFPILLAFAITINKAHGQSLELCGLDLSVDCFSHGQLYVACSIVGKPDSLYIYANNGKTKNIVYPQVLQN